MSITGPTPELEIPEVALTAFVLDQARDFAGKPALIDAPTGRALTFGALDEQVRRLAAGLASRGLGKGGVLALLAPNIPEYGVVFHATTLTGAAVTTINPAYKADEIRRQLEDSQARVMVTVPDRAEQAAGAADAAGVEEVLVVGEDPFLRLLEAQPLAGQVAVDPAEDVAALPYSSGTSGLPKGVMLTHRNLVANVCQVQATIPLEPSDVLIGVLPFFHIYGMNVIMNAALRAGATVVTMPRFDLRGFLAAIQGHRVTRAYVVPPIVLALAKDPLVDEYDLSSLGFVNSGAAPLGAELQLACAERLGCPVGQGYGLTETSPATHGPVHPGLPIKPGTIGVPVPNVECRIVDVETGVDAEPAQPGELWMRGPNVMKGYLRNDDAARAAIDADGWFHTGDVATVDEDGCFRIVDRVKELIKYKGFQVAPAELEAVIIDHPLVADVAVIAMPDEECGEVPKAFVVTTGALAEDELRAFVAERLTTYKQVRAVEFVESIPKSPTGKILRRVLVERERASARQMPA